MHAIPKALSGLGSHLAQLASAKDAKGPAGQDGESSWDATHGGASGGQPCGEHVTGLLFAKTGKFSGELEVVERQD